MIPSTETDIGTETDADDYPSWGQVNHVEKIIRADPECKEMLELSNKLMLRKRGGEEKKPVLRQAAIIAKRLAASGQSVFMAKKRDILATANEVLKNGASASDTISSPEPSTKTKKGKDKEKEDDRPAKATSGTKVNQNIAVVSLLLSGIQIAENDQEPNAQKRLDALRKLKDEYIAVASISR